MAPEEQTQFTYPKPRADHIVARNQQPFGERAPSRLVPMRVLNLGLCRTGTASLRLALLHMGYADVYHMSSVEGAPDSECEAWLAAMRAKEVAQNRRRTRNKEENGKDAAAAMSDEERRAEQVFWDRMTGHVEAASDIPTSLFPEELLRCYPDAKVVLTVRGDAKGRDDETASRRPKHLAGAETFATSTCATILALRNRTWWMAAGLLPTLFVSLVPVPRRALVRRATFRLLFDVLSAEESEALADDHARLARIYQMHNARVMSLCEEQGREVLVYNVAEGWAPLLEFLGERDVPRDENGERREFPRLNDTATFHRIVGVKMAEMKAAARRQRRKLLSIVGSGLLVGALLWQVSGWWWLRR